MLPGNYIIIACPLCGALENYETLMSGNTFDASWWTDGKMIAPMLPEPPQVVACHSCKKVFWLSDAEEIGEVEPWFMYPRMKKFAPEHEHPDWLDSPKVKEPSLASYYRALKQGLAKTPEEEKMLRAMAFHRMNDPLRRPKTKAAQEFKLSSKDQDNMLRLAELMDLNVIDDLIMTAEIMRELGRFEEAVALLKDVKDEDYQEIVQMLLTLCQKQDSLMRQLG